MLSCLAIACYFLEKPSVLRPDLEKESFWVFSIKCGPIVSPSQQNLADSVGESLGIVVVQGGNPRGNLGCKWNENPRRKELKWEGNFPKPVNILIHHKMTSLGYEHITGTRPMSLNCILKFLREAGGKFPHGKIPRDSTGKGGGLIHVENSP